MDDKHRFSYVVRKIVGKRLTYKELTGKLEPHEAIYYTRKLAGASHFFRGNVFNDTLQVGALTPS